MDTCPNCHRRLLSHASAKCNWCGCEINDEGYQQQAAQERAAFRIHEAERDAIEAARSAAMLTNILPGIGLPLTALGAWGNTWQRGKQMEAIARAQAKAMEEYADTGVGRNVNGVNLQPPWQPPGSQQQMPANSQPPSPANPAPPAQDQEEPPTAQDDVKQMFRHLEL